MLYEIEEIRKEIEKLEKMDKLNIKELDSEILKELILHFYKMYYEIKYKKYNDYIEYHIEMMK